MSRKLTKKTQKLVEQNHNLIHTYMKEYKLKNNSVNDWYGTLAVGLCEAAIDYTESNGSFKEFAYTYFEKEVAAVRERNRQCVEVVANIGFFS